MKALVTGGAGFIGSHVVDRLIAAGVETRVLVSGFRSVKHPSILNGDAVVFKGDLLDFQSLRKATRRVDVVFHLASVLSHYCEVYPHLALAVNVLGTWNLKQASVENNVEQIFFASSSFVYGEPNSSPISEECPVNPKDLFGLTKYDGEKIVQLPYAQRGMAPDGSINAKIPMSKVKYTILRLFNVYGPRAYPDKLYSSVISTWIPRALKKESLEIHGDGTQSLDFIYVEDVADAFIACLKEPKAANQTFNVASGHATSMNRIAYFINTITGNPCAPHYNIKHLPFLTYVQGNINKIEALVSWKPKASLYSGLERTVQFFQEMKA